MVALQSTSVVKGSNAGLSLSTLSDVGLCWTFRRSSVGIMSLGRESRL